MSSARKSAKCDVPALCSPKKKANLLHRSFHADAPNKIWVSDVTCIKLKNRYYYICVIIDLFSRKVVSYRIGLSNSTQLVTSTFKSAYQKRVPCGELTFHSDQGTPYTSYAFQRLLHQRHVKQSFSNPGSPLDNAVAESFFSTMKKEELYRIDYQSEAQFRQRVDAYVSFFNHVRPHMSLNYKDTRPSGSQFHGWHNFRKCHTPWFRSWRFFILHFHFLIFALMRFGSVKSYAQISLQTLGK